MADLQDDRKKEEEEYGGFEPESDGNESFMLGDENEYPAKLPDDFGGKPQPVEELTPSSEQVDANEDEPPAEEPDTTPEEPLEAEVPELEAIDPIAEEEPADEEPPADEPEELDDEFKNKLLADIENSKSKREVENAEGSAESAKPIGDDAETNVVLNDIKADKPSNAGLGEAGEVDEKVPPIVVPTPPPSSEEKQTTVEEEAPKEKKKRPVWVLMLYTAVATFILTLGLSLLLWSLLDDNGQNKQEVGRTKKMAQVRVKPSETPKSKATQSAEDKWLDSMKSNDGDSDLTYSEDKDEFSSLEDKPAAKEKPKAVAPKMNLPKVKPQQSKPVVKKATPKKTEDMVSNTEQSKPKPKQSTPNIDESQFAMPQPKGPVPEKGVFMVQIYSSPSREDAESWLGQLKARQVSNAVITEQEIKGRTWYRVRYGNFETKEEARASALKLGYSQSWIDRVK
jgi:hypothetical protein